MNEKDQHFNDIKKTDIVQSERKLKAAQKLAKLGYFEVNIKTRELNWSDEVFEIFNKDKTTYTPALDEFYSFSHPGDRSSIKMAFEKSLKGENPYDIQHRIILDDGQVKYIKELCETTFDEEGKPNILFGIIQDITNLVLARQELKENEEYLNTIFENSPIIMMLLNDKSEIVKINKLGVEFSNKALNDIIGSQPGEIFDCIKISRGKYKCGKSPDCNQCVLRNTIINSLETHRSHFKVETLLNLFKKKRKADIFVNISTKHITVRGKAFILMTLDDITKTKKAEEAINQRILALTQPETEVSNLEFEDLFNLDEVQAIQDVFVKATGVASVITDIDGNPITKPSNFNNFCKLLCSTGQGLLNCAFSNKQVISKNQSVPYNKCKHAGLLEAGSDIMAGNKPVARWLIGQVGCESTSINEIKKYALSLGLEENKVDDALSSLKIIPEEQFLVITKAINLITRQLSILALQNIQQAREINNRITIEKELVKAMQKAEESDRLKSSFLANMSHELRTPLNGLIGFTELLTSTNKSEAQKRFYGNIIKQSAGRLLQIITNIIDLSRIDTGELKVVTREFKINQLLGEISTNFRARLAEENRNNIQLKLCPANNDIIFECDDSKINQIFCHLLDNAIKFTPSGTIEFGIFSYNATDISFFVSDTGIGIKPNHYQLIFERFRQLDDSNKRKFGGNGLGLTIAKGLIDLLDGNIKVISEYGMGTAFHFTISGKTFVETEKKEDIISKKKVKNAHGKLNVLVVEDDYASILFIEEILSKTETEITTVTSGKDARKAVSRNSFDVIFMDIRLPDINGLDLVKEIRKTDNDVYIIAQTAYASITDKIISIEAGCNDYLPKPIKKKDLIKMINSRFKIG